MDNEEGNENVNEIDSLLSNSGSFDYLDNNFTYPMTSGSGREDVIETMTFYAMDDESQNIILDSGMAMTPPTPMPIPTEEDNVNPTTSTSQNPEVPYENPFQVTSASAPPNPDYPRGHAEWEVDSVAVSTSPSASDVDDNVMVIDIPDSDDEMVIDFPDPDVPGDINTDAPGLEIEPERRNKEIKLSIQSILESPHHEKIPDPDSNSDVEMERVIQEVAEAIKVLRHKLAVLASKLAKIESENKACREELEDLKKNFKLRMKELWDKHLMDCTISELNEFFDRNSFNLDLQAVKEELNNQEALLNAIAESSRANRNLEATSSNDTGAGTGTSNDAETHNSGNVSSSGVNIAHSDQLIPFNNVWQIVENVIPNPQPQLSQMLLPISFRVFNHISNQYEAPIPIPIPRLMQIQQPVSTSTSTTLSSTALMNETESLPLPSTSRSKISPEPEGKEGGKAKRKRKSAGNKENREACSNCLKVLDKYYLKKECGHKKHCKSIRPPPSSNSVKSSPSNFCQGKQQ